MAGKEGRKGGRCCGRKKIKKCRAKCVEVVDGRKGKEAIAKYRGIETEKQRRAGRSL